MKTKDYYIVKKGEKSMIIAPISAIPSWEGFVYQRHIALYMALKQIWSDIQSGNKEELCLYKLGIEGADDFSIIKSDINIFQLY
ncbi:MAG: hypothetical protein ACK5H4_06050, partial [Lacrimispora sphenoides]